MSTLAGTVAGLVFEARAMGHLDQARTLATKYGLALCTCGALYAPCAEDPFCPHCGEPDAT